MSEIHCARNRILLASSNPKKLGELVGIVSDCGIEIVTPEQLGLRLEVVEDGSSFQENASKKACEYARASRLCALADDSGLEVEALGGRPGIRSARYASEAADYARNNAKLLKEMKDVPNGKRKARFRCCIAFAHPQDGLLFTVEGDVEGLITRKPRGQGGFGYDPLFYYPPADRTFAEMKSEEKNKVSHRYRALAKFKEKLRQYM
jgi:XTP/dITP diphosphohydrolase